MLYRIIDMAADIVDQILAGDAHEVTTDVAHIVGRIIVAHVGVDRRQSLRHRAGTLHRRLVDQLDADLVTVRCSGVDPAAQLEGAATGRHAATDDEDVDILLDHFGVTETVLAHRGAPPL